MSQLGKVARRFLDNESGFTLAELMVTIMLMLTVMFALYSIFDMSLRVFSFGNDKTEAVENARLGLERMERELRTAYPYTKLDGDRQVDTDTSTEQITYSLNGSDLERNGASMVQSVAASGLRFDYLRADGSTATSESEVRVVRITLTVQVDRGLAGPATQTLTTDVALRNRTG